MTQKIILTGMASKLSGRKEMEIDNVTSLTKLEQILLNKIPGLEDYKYSFAVDGNLIRGDDSIDEKCQILVFNPFSGG